MVIGGVGLTAGWPAGAARAAEQEPVTLEEVTVTAKPSGPFLPAVEGTKIYAGKKATVTPLAKLPTIQNNNYRQGFSQTSGLLVSEQNNQAHVNVNYRGIGDPHESQDVLVLKDGLPIGMDRLGYSTSYYTPPMEAVKAIEVIRGGSALLYGPQPGPVINYVTYDPPLSAPSFTTQHRVGSYGTYSTFNRIGGTADRLGYLGYAYYRHSNGPRSNEGFDLSGGSTKFVLDATKDRRWTWAVDAHESESGEPGRLTLAQYQTDRRQTPRPGDRLWVSRYASSLAYEHDLSPDTALAMTLYGNYFDRYSRRRTSNTSTQNNLDRREVSAGGAEARLRHDYQAWGGSHTMTAGSTLYIADAPRTQDRSAVGAYPTDEGSPIFDFNYRTVYGAFFGENVFRAGALSVIPALRVDLLNQRVKENFNTGKTSPLHNINEFSAVPLVGLGLTYDLGHANELFANASQGYKPPQFDDLAPTGNNTLPGTDLDTGKTWTYEAGVRGTPRPWLTYDASAFLTDYENYFGTVTVGANTQRRNVGRARYHGVDLGAEVNLLGLAGQGDHLGSLSLYGNASLLEARFVEGPLRDREPAYAPRYLLKYGLIYRLADRLKLALLGTTVEDHYWADDNLPGGTGTTGIPTYTVWDFTGELAVYKDTAKAIFGINNLTDEVYFSRVRSDGIEPALERNYYAGVSITF